VLKDVNTKKEKMMELVKFVITNVKLVMMPKVVLLVLKKLTELTHHLVHVKINGMMTVLKNVKNVIIDVPLVTKKSNVSLVFQVD